MAFTRTKIICTIEPNSSNKAILKTLEHVRDVLKPLHRKKKLKFVMVSGIFSEKHSEAIQIINF